MDSVHPSAALALVDLATGTLTTVALSPSSFFPEAFHPVTFRLVGFPLLLALEMEIPILLNLPLMGDCLLMTMAV